MAATTVNFPGELGTSATPTPNTNPKHLNYNIPSPHDVHFTQGMTSFSRTHTYLPYLTIVFIVMALTFASIGLIWTATRLWIRRKSFWWDDLCAGLACLFQIAQVTMFMVNNEKPPVAAGEDIARKVFINHMNGISFIFMDWFARTAILYSVILITPNIGTRKVLHWVALVFWMCALTHLFLFIGHCERFSEWKYSVFPICTPGKPIPIFQMIIAILADTLLIVIPINTLRLLTSAPGMRRVLMVIFGASVLRTIATIVQCVMTFKDPGIKMLQSWLVEGFVAVFVASLAVIAVAIMQLLGFHEVGDSGVVGSLIKPAHDVMSFNPNSNVKNPSPCQTRYAIEDILDSNTILGGTGTYYTLNELGVKDSDQDTEEKEPENRSRSSSNSSGGDRDIERAHPMARTPVIVAPNEQSPEFLSEWKGVDLEDGIDKVLRRS